jgi:hypothetical protein
MSEYAIFWTFLLCKHSFREIIKEKKMCFFRWGFVAHAVVLRKKRHDITWGNA